MDSPYRCAGRDGLVLQPKDKDTESRAVQIGECLGDVPAPTAESPYAGLSRWRTCRLSGWPTLLAVRGEGEDQEWAGERQTGEIRAAAFTVNGPVHLAGLAEASARGCRSVPNGMLHMFTFGEGVRIAPRHRPERTQGIPRQNVLARSAMDAPPNLVDVDRAHLVTVDAERTQDVRWRRARQHGVDRQIAAHSPSSISPSTGPTDSPCNSHSRTDFG